MITESMLNDWNNSAVTKKLKDRIKELTDDLQSAVMEGDCSDRNSLYIACVSEYKALKCILMDELLKLESSNENNQYRIQPRIS